MNTLMPFSEGITTRNPDIFETAKDAFNFYTGKKPFPKGWKEPKHPKGFIAPAGYLPTLIAAGELGHTKKELDSLMTKIEAGTLSDKEWAILEPIVDRGCYWEEKLGFLQAKKAGFENWNKLNKLLNKSSNKSESNTIPFGEYYHKDRGWY